MAVTRIMEFKPNSQEARKKNTIWSAMLLFLSGTAGTMNHVCPLYSIFQISPQLNYTAESMRQLLASNVKRGFCSVFKLFSILLF